MAKAKTFTREITRKVIDEVPGYVELNLTPEEASFLLSVMHRIGGSPKTSPRKHADAIAGALCSIGVQPDAGSECCYGKDSIYYNNFS